jgi:hypothetical protein
LLVLEQGDGGATGGYTERRPSVRVASMVNFFLRRGPAGQRAASDDTVPEEIARALDASAEDMRENRTEDIGDFLQRMEARLESHLAAKGSIKP